MFNEIHIMLGTEENSDITKSIENNAIALFLETLRAWGPLSSLKERIKLHRLASEKELSGHVPCDLNVEVTLKQTRLRDEAERNIRKRLNQSASSYLIQTSGRSSNESTSTIEVPAGLTFDSLYSIRNLISTFTPNIQTYSYESRHKENNQKSIEIVSLEALAELNFMKGDYEEALKYNLMLGILYPITKLTDLKNEAIESVLGENKSIIEQAKYAKNKHILTLIENCDLHYLLLDENLLNIQSTTITKTPMVALISLLGLKISGRFLVRAATLPEGRKTSLSSSPRKSRTTLPIDLIALQLQSCPEFLHWFLHQVFCDRPEIYVKFPNTAVPPSAITDLHRTHFQLHVTFAKRQTHIKGNLSNIPSYDEMGKETPLLTFLKVSHHYQILKNLMRNDCSPYLYFLLQTALPHGGIRSDDVRRDLELQRQGEEENFKSNEKKSITRRKVKYPHLFASELAYIIERSGSGKEDDAKKVLYLYLEGEVSLPQAVAFAERNAHSARLWETLVSFCLNPESSRLNPTTEQSANGNVFGSLLEVAARLGADLSQLVSKIPKGMCIEGIRPKLVAAISDYQTKQQIHQYASAIFQNEKISLLREQIHRSRRGIRSTLGIDPNELKQFKSKLNVASEGNEKNDLRMLQSKHRRQCLDEHNEPGVKLPHVLFLS